MDGSLGLFYVSTANSSAQQKFTQERFAALVEQRKQRATLNSGAYPLDPLERTVSNTSLMKSGALPDDVSRGANSNLRNDYGDMDYGRAPTTASSDSSSLSEKAHQILLNDPYELRHGRRYLREVPYPLPVDLVEISRQNLRTLLSCKVFGRPLCSPRSRHEIPRNVLEIGCGSAYWTALCHDYFSSLGHHDVSFVGLDVAPLAPDLKRQGVDFTFVQHDMRRIPLPFEDEEFDLVMLKDTSMSLPLGVASQRLLDESIRILRTGGVIEIWESDHVVRSLLPHPPILSKHPIEQQDIAAETATFPIAIGTPFAQAQNKYLNQANGWISEALDARKLPPTPCSRIEAALKGEPDSLAEFGVQRVAIPLSELKWERESFAHSRSASQTALMGHKHDSVMSKGKGRVVDKPLTPDQAALRQIALLTVVQMIEGLEPLLKEVSGKNAEEWSHWWSSMYSDVMHGTKGGLTSECLEIGAWWATKITTE